MHSLSLEVCEAMETLSAESSPGIDKRLGQILVERNIISLKQLSAALYSQQEMKAKGGRVFKLGEILLFTEQLNMDQLRGALSSQVNRARESRAATAKMKEKHEAEVRQNNYRRLKQAEKNKGFFSKLLSKFSR